MPHFTVNLNGKEVPLPEAETRDQALLKAGLTPAHWKETEGKMNDNETTREDKYSGRGEPVLVKTRKTRADKGQPRKQKPASKPPSAPARLSRAKSNITTADIGKVYESPTGELYRLRNCGMVTMDRVGNGEGDAIVTASVAEFANYIRLVPEKHR